MRMNNAHFLCETDPFVLFEQMGVTDPSHAFYLGYELMKAKTALTLNKNYRQDQALDWGFLTEPEVSHRDRKQGPGRAEGSAVILEGIVTTLSPDGTLNVAPMGPQVEPDDAPVRPPAVPDLDDLPNLKARGEGVLHVTDDVLLLARTAIGAPVEAETRPADGGCAGGSF